MREWIPVSTSPKGRLALRALEDFGSRTFQDVTVGELAAGAGVTTGSLYHHFDSKLGLYSFVRDEAERRLLDRMEGAASARAGDGIAAVLQGALIVGFDFAAGQGFVRLLGDAHPARDLDPVADLLAKLSHGGASTAGKGSRGRMARGAHGRRRGLAAGARACGPGTAVRGRASVAQQESGRMNWSTTVTEAPGSGRHGLGAHARRL